MGCKDSSDPGLHRNYNKIKELGDFLWCRKGHAPGFNKNRTGSEKKKRSVIAFSHPALKRPLPEKRLLMLTCRD